MYPQVSTNDSGILFADRFPKDGEIATVITVNILQSLYLGPQHPDVQQNVDQVSHLGREICVPLSRDGEEVHFDATWICTKVFVRYGI